MSFHDIDAYHVPRVHRATPEIGPDTQLEDLPEEAFSLNAADNAGEQLKHSSYSYFQLPTLSNRVFIVVMLIASLISVCMCHVSGSELEKPSLGGFILSTSFLSMSLAKDEWLGRRDFEE
jgi:hypothetical protein